MQERLNAQRERLQACTRDLESKASEHHGLVEEGRAADLKMQELQHEIAKSQKTAKEAASLVHTKKSGISF